jgi:crotonobetainyl-CoA:carnitine CoA-transferase CaiB-like acyl-CoA transferase
MELVTDPRFQEMGTRLGNYVDLVAILKDEVLKWPSAELVARAREEGATFGPVNNVGEFLEDPQVKHRQTVRILDDERFGATRYLAPPWGFSRTPASIDRHAPRLGEHSDEILLELGLDQGEIDALRRDKAIR